MLTQTTPERLEEPKLQLERDKFQRENKKFLFEQRKFEAEAEKREQESTKLEAEAAKTNLEATNLREPFWRRSTWVFPLVQGLAIAITVAGSVFSATLNQQMFDLRLKQLQSQAEIDTAEERRKRAEAQSDQNPGRDRRDGAVRDQAGAGQLDHFSVDEYRHRRIRPDPRHRPQPLRPRVGLRHPLQRRLLPCDRRSKLPQPSPQRRSLVGHLALPQRLPACVDGRHIAKSLVRIYSRIGFHGVPSSDEICASSTCQKVTPLVIPS